MDKITRGYLNPCVRPLRGAGPGSLLGYIDPWYDRVREAYEQAGVSPAPPWEEPWGDEALAGYNPDTGGEDYMRSARDWGMGRTPAPTHHSGTRHHMWWSDDGGWHVGPRGQTRSGRAVYDTQEGRDAVERLDQLPSYKTGFDKEMYNPAGWGPTRMLSSYDRQQPQGPITNPDYYKNTSAQAVSAPRMGYGNPHVAPPDWPYLEEAPVLHEPAPSGVRGLLSKGKAALAAGGRAAKAVGSAVAGPQGLDLERPRTPPQPAPAPPPAPAAPAPKPVTPPVPRPTLPEGEV